MKKILFVISFTMLSFVFAAAQPRGAADRARQAMGNVASTMTLSTDKTLLEPNEATSIVVGVMLPPVMDSNGDITELPDFAPLTPGPDSPYRVTNWKIVEGGGTIITIDGGSASYNAPATAPPNRTMTVSVDLVPQLPGFPKVVLLQKLYFVQNETAIYVNMPQLGLNATKFVARSDGGTKIPTMDPRAAAGMTPALRAQMAQAQAAMAASQAQSGINLSAISSNAMSLYDPANDQTAVKFTSINVEMDNGARVTSPMDAFFSFNYKGQGVGTHQLTDDGKGLALFITALHNGVECGTNKKLQNGKVMACTGFVTITAMDDKFVTGTLRTVVYANQGASIFRGYLYGKFKVNRAR